MANFFEGKVVLVTGGGSGMGRASALAFAKVGAKAVVADVSIEGGEETVRMIKDIGGEAIFVQADVSKAVEVEMLIYKVTRNYGRLDYAHNNAGIEGTQTFTVECSEENWDRVIGVNLKGVWLCMKYEIPQMLQAGGGAIVNTASTFGLVGSKIGLPAYIASKHGVIGLTKAAALEYAQKGIRVNAVCPGTIQTPMYERVNQVATGGDPEAKVELGKQILAKEPTGRIGRPEEVAEAVIWLCSEAASFVTGHTMVVDGGLIAQ